MAFVASLSFIDSRLLTVPEFNFIKIIQPLAVLKFRHYRLAFAGETGVFAEPRFHFLNGGQRLFDLPFAAQ